MSFLIEETKFDPMGSALFDAFFDIKNEEACLFDDELLLDLDSIDFSSPAQPTKLTNKRKSLDWDAKPLEHHRANAAEVVTVAQHQPPVKRKRGRPRKNKAKEQPAAAQISLEPFPFRPHVQQLSNLFLDHKDIKPVNKELLKARKSEDWSAKPVQQTKRRLKWSPSELRRLWEGIAEHGNNWTEIRGMFTSRSYCQIKDKGRRCLFLLGWETGRSKAETDYSNVQAKRLAKEVLVKMSKA